MRTLPNIHLNSMLAVFACLFALAFVTPVYAEHGDASDRIDIVTQQINLLKNRYQQVGLELANLQSNEAPLSISTIEQASKNLLDKASLDISVSKSNLESINIELDDVKQTVGWLGKR